MKTSSTAIAAAAGAAVMYFFDPDRGRARRAKVRDKAFSLTRRTGRRAERTTRHVRSRAEGLRDKLAAGPEAAPAADQVVADKIRSEVLRNDTYPGIVVNVENGVATLRGSLDDPAAISALEQEVQKVTGVLDVRNLVQGPDSPQES